MSANFPDLHKEVSALLPWFVKILLSNLSLHKKKTYNSADHRGEGEYEGDLEDGDEKENEEAA